MNSEVIFSLFLFFLLQLPALFLVDVEVLVARPGLPLEGLLLELVDVVDDVEVLVGGGVHFVVQDVVEHRGVHELELLDDLDELLRC